MFRVGPVGEQEPHDPFANLDPSNPPHPSSRMGKAVVRRANQLRKMYIGRRKANEGYHHLRTDKLSKERHRCSLFLI
eukprot:3271139-Amphidinium_carterae.1